MRIRTALGGGGGGECLRNLRHQFLTLNMTGARLVRQGAGAQSHWASYDGLTYYL